MQADSSKFVSLLFEYGFQIVIRPRNKRMMQKAPSNGPENVGLHPNIALSLDIDFKNKLYLKKV